MSTPTGTLNLAQRWAEMVADPTLRDLPYKIELNAGGKIEMTPASNRHGRLQRVGPGFATLNAPTRDPWVLVAGSRRSEALAVAARLREADLELAATPHSPPRV